MPYIIQPHISQYDTFNSPVTRVAGCTWTTVANGIAAVTGGKKHPTPDQVHAKVPHWQETDPSKPGWSIGDAVKAAAAYGVKLVDHTGDGWGAVVAYHDAGYYLLIQGDSDQLSYGCSGEFKGDHALGASPAENALGLWMKDDPICPDHRWESSAYLKRYAEKLYKGVCFAQFLPKVPKTNPGTFVAAKAGTYKTYKVVNGQAVNDSELKTRGWPKARAKTITATQVDGSGQTTLLRLLTGVHAGTILYRYADGLTVTEGD